MEELNILTSKMKYIARLVVFQCRGGHCPPVRYNVANSPKTDANMQIFSARAINDRPYVHHRNASEI